MERVAEELMRDATSWSKCHCEDGRRRVHTKSEPSQGLLFFILPLIRAGTQRGTGQPIATSLPQNQKEKKKS